MTKEEFCEVFAKKMISLAGTETFVGGGSIADYAKEIAETYWNEPDQRELGPEEAAAEDFSYWE